MSAVTSMLYYVGCSTVDEINESFIRRPMHSSLPVSRL